MLSGPFTIKIKVDTIWKIAFGTLLEWLSYINMPLSKNASVHKFRVFWIFLESSRYQNFYYIYHFFDCTMLKSTKLWSRRPTVEIESTHHLVSMNFKIRYTFAVNRKCHTKLLNLTMLNIADSVLLYLFI